MSFARTSWVQTALAWRQKLGVRIVAVLIAVSGLFAILGNVYDFRVEEQVMRERLLAHGRSMTRQAVLACPDFVIIEADWPRLAAYAEELVAIDPAVEFVVVHRSDGTTVAASPPNSVPRQTAETLLIAEPIFADPDQPEIATFYLGLSTLPMLADLRDRTVRLLLRSSVTFLLVGVVLWYVLRLVVVRPIRRLDEQAQRLGRGELAAPIPDFGSTELGRLGRTLDEMRRNLQQSHVSMAEQNRRLVELDRLKSQFLANMSHEMRTPLTSILGGIQLLGDTGLGAMERAEFSASVRRNGEQLLELVDSLLDLTKLESGNLLIDARACRPAEVIAKACERLREKAKEKGLDLRVDTAAIDSLVIHTDPTRLQQLVRNVVDNAVKFTEAGTVAVTAALLQPSAPLLQVVVQDTGPGIPAEFLAHVLAPFRQVDGSLTRRHGGSGLGLHMAQQVARRLGGDVTVSSEPGRGTRVEITVGAPAARVAAPVVVSRKLRVLVVDDAPDNRHLLKVVLAKLGVSVELAENGRVAVDRVKATGAEAPFDLVLMDLQMPELDGIGAIRELRASGCDVPIVTLTAHSLADDRERSLAAGADGYETKPVSLQRLGEIVATYVRRARP